MTYSYEIDGLTGPAEVRTVWADAVGDHGQTAWVLDFPRGGEVWSADRQRLADWLRNAADEVLRTGPCSADSLAQWYAGACHAQCSCGEVFSAPDQPTAEANRFAHVRQQPAAVSA